MVNKGVFTVERVVYFLCGLLEILLAFRFIFRLAGAGSGGFVIFIYSITDGLSTPFNYIFRTQVVQGNTTTGFFDYSILIAMVVYALIAWGIVKLIDIVSGKRSSGTTL
jgi:hypothetical protein